MIDDIIEDLNQRRDYISEAIREGHRRDLASQDMLLAESKACISDELQYIDELLDKYAPKEIDWMKIPIDTDVIVSVRGGDKHIRKFAMYLPSRLGDAWYCFDAGALQKDAYSISAWPNCRLADETNIPKEWLKS